MPAFLLYISPYFWYIAKHLMDSRIIDTEPLKEITGGDMHRMKRYANIFLEGLPGYLDQIRKALADRDWEAMYQVIHSIKPHVKMMGMVKLSPDIDRREKRFTANISDEDLHAEAGIIIELLQEASAELKMFVQDID